MSKNRIKTNYSKPIEFLKRQFNQLALSNLDKGNELTSKQMIGYVQSIYAQLQLLQQIMMLDDDTSKNEDIDLNNKLPANKYTDDILINLNNAISLAVTFYDRTDKQEILKSIKLIEEYIEEVQIDLDLLSLDIEPNNFKKIKKKKNVSHAKLNIDLDW